MLHYAKGAVRAVSRATSSAGDALRPEVLPNDTWEQHGWKLPVDMAELASPIPLTDIPIEMRAEKAQRMFTTAGKVHQGYLYPVTVDWFSRFAQLFHSQLPEEVLTGTSTVPAEVADGAEVLLRNLIGVELETISGRTNVILGLDGGNACALCGEEMPVDLLIAAHIKQRSVAGGDDWYELGYLSVNDVGTSPP
ncbi:MULTISPECIES: hypothetical protein [Amycolatopsis]|uniref:hypothetical protein n=1 Tax=Amycolatopsis TaxID=1813 RepID=UPI0011778578|nr:MULTISPECIES: hypothetical protein [Amycolatopsis]